MAYGNIFFACAAMYPRVKFTTLVAPLFLFDQNPTIFHFEMAESVQNWRQKWFCIKDHKSSDAEEYGLAPFDPAKALTKLTSWDALPSETEAEEIKSLLAHIQELKNVAKIELHGTQLIVFFLQ
jgi:hypothetical protein